MNDSRRRLFPDQNPFSTACVKPGVIEFRFSGDASAAKLVAQLRESRWRGQIVGPHGSGKSTLLQTLLPVLKSAGRDVRCFIARPNDPQLPNLMIDQQTWSGSTQVVIEGYELLSRRNRRQIDRLCREKQAGLLITCHATQGLPTLLQTSVTRELAVSLVEQLLPNDCDFIAPADVQESFGRHNQDLRELLFEMYDLYERRRPGELRQPP